MKKTIYTSTIVLLILSGLAACFGGLMLLTDPTGERLGLTLNRLRFLPFRDYLLPGLLLFVLIGAGSLVVAVMMIKKARRARLLLILQGVVFLCWAFLQAMTISSSLVYIFGIAGMLLIINGFILSGSIH
jgi:hypothetical protein